MPIQNTTTPNLSVPTTAALSLVSAPNFPLAQGCVAYVVSPPSYWSFQPGYLAAVDAFHVTAAGGGFWQWEGITGDLQATYRGMVEQPIDATGTVTTGTILVTASEYVYRFTAKNGGTIANVIMQTTVAQSTSTAATTLSASAAVAGTGGVVRLTTGSTASWATGDIAVVTGLVGTTEGNGTWALTVVDGTHVELIGSVFVNTYVSGGTVTRSVNTVAIYDSAGNWVAAAADQVAAWEGAAGTQTMAIANTAVGTVKLSPGKVYYLVVICKATTPATMLTVAAAPLGVNIGLTAAKIISGTLATSGVTKLPATITPASIVVTSNIPVWYGIS